MKILVCGGRNYKNAKEAFRVLDQLNSLNRITEVISGGATGADTLGILWGNKNKILVRIFPANWNKHGKGAGPIRNQQMLDDGIPDLIYAFPGGIGTQDMIGRAQRQYFIVVNYPDIRTVT